MSKKLTTTYKLVSVALLAILATNYFLYTQQAQASFALSVRNSGGNEISQSSTAFGISNAISAPSLLIVSIGIDNKSTADGNTSDVTNVIDSKGNIYTKAGEFTNTVGGVANDGATIAVWYSVLGTSLGTSDTVSASYSAAVVAKAITMESYTLGAGQGHSVFVRR